MPNNLPILKTRVSYFEMTENPNVSDVSLEGFVFGLEAKPDVQTYVETYREIGRDYIWNYRPGQSTEEIADIINSSKTEIYYLRDQGHIIGIAEIDLSDTDNIEIVHFGLLPNYINKGLGKDFLQKVIHTVWQKNPARVWLATCDLDHEKAPEFYSNAGFKFYKETPDVTFYDYRYSDFYNLTDAPQIPHGENLNA